MLGVVLSLVLGPPTLPPPADPGTGAVPPTPAEIVAAAVDLSWTTPPECPPATRVREGIAGLLGAATDAAAASDVRVRAVITVQGPAYRLDLQIETPSGQTTKTMLGARCEVLVDATSLISAIAIDPNAVLDATESPVLPPQPEPEVEPDPVPTEQPAVRRPARRDVPLPAAEPKLPSRVPLVRFALQAAGGVDIATLPGVSGGVAALGAVFGPRWRAEVTGLVLFPRTGQAVTGAGARIGLFALGGRGCWVPTVRRVELPLCGGGEAGALRGDPVGDRVVDPRPVREPYVAAIGSLGVAWAPRPFFAVIARGELAVPILRPSFVIGEALAHQIPGASGRFFAGLEARFP